MSRLFRYVTARSFATVLLLWKEFHFMKCCFFSESHLILVTWVLIFGSPPWKVHGKTLCSVYCWSLAKFMEKNRVFELSTHSQFSHSNLFILSRQILCWPCLDPRDLIVLVLMVEEADVRDFFFQKQLVSIFFCSITCF